jgi:hypothetical protein
VQDYVQKHWRIPKERKKKLGSVPPHGSVTAKCTLCHVHHSKKQHKFHGQGAFHKTHLWGFAMNRPKTYAAYLRAQAKRRGWTLKQTKRYFQSGKAPRGAKAQANPATPELPLLYGKILQVTGQKTQKHRCDSGCKKVSHRYYHNFKTGPKEWGLPAGAIVTLPSGEQFRIPERSLLIAKKLTH